jgi:hypothetical protein
MSSQTHARYSKARRMEFEDLEARLLFSADPLVASLLGVDALMATQAAATPATALMSTVNGSVTSQVQSTNAAASTAQPSHLEVVFVDAGIDHAEQLVRDLRQQDGQLRVVLIGANEDGIAVITETLKSFHGVDAVHIISHGDAQGIQLGQTFLDQATLQLRAGQIAQWSQSLNAQADLLLYGCNLAANLTGQTLVSDLSLLTGADVAASTNMTGARSMGGDWTLEYSTGHIDTLVAANGLTQAEWQGTLALTPAGGETLVHTPTNSGANETTTANKQVAMDSSGNYVAVWQDGTNILAQRFTAAGATNGAKITVTNTGSPANAQVAMNASGAFVVVWNNSSNSIIFQRYNSSGVAQGGATTVASASSSGSPAPWPYTITTITPSDVSVGINTVGDFVVVYHQNTSAANYPSSFYPVPSSTTVNDAIMFKAYSAEGAAQASNATGTISSTNEGNDAPSIAMNASGAFVVSWTDSSGNIYERPYNASRTAVTAAADATNGGGGSESTVAINDSGNYVVAYNDAGVINYRTYNSAGTATNSVSQANLNPSGTTPSASRSLPTVAIDSTGNFVIAWQHANQDGSGNGVYMRQFYSNGTSGLADTAVATTTANAQQTPSIAMVGNKLVVLWNGNGSQTGQIDNQGVYFQRYTTSANVAPTVTTSGGSLAYSESTGAQVVDGGITVSDIDSSLLQSAVMTLSGAYVNGQDVLGFANQNGITGTWNAAAGTMTLSGTATLANYQTALRSITYTNTSDTPNTTTRTISVTANDGSLNSSAATRAITITAVNDAPTATITPATYAATEQTPLTLHGTGLSIADLDAGSSTVVATVSVVSGVLSAGAGTTGVAISGSGSNTITLTGTLAQINNLLAGTGSGTLSYIINSDAPPASDTLTLSINDQGNTGSGGALSGSDTATINIAAVNDAPTATITPTTYAATEQTSLALHGTGLSIGDADAASSAVKVTFTVVSGTLSAAAGTTGVTVGGSGTNTLTLTGTVLQINNLLAGVGSGTLNYVINSDTPPASDTLTMTANDQGNTGSGGAKTGSDTATINITAVNDAPVATITPTTYAATEQTSLTLHGTGLSISDTDAASGTMQVTLTVLSGTLSAGAGTTGATVGGSGTNTLTLTGTVTQINNLLAGLGSGTLSYLISSDTPPASDALTMTANDGGNTGTGGAQTGSDTATINISAVNDAPVASITPTTYAATEQTSLTLHGTGLTISDADAASSAVRVTFTVVSGTLSATAGTTGVTVGGSGTSTVVLTGTVTQINNLLAGAGSGTLSYVINSDTPPASDTLTMSVNDQGNTGSGGAKVGSDTATINITAVNDVPVATITPTTYAATEQTSLTLHGTGLSISDADAASSTVKATFTVTAGTLSAAAGTTGVTVGGSGTSTVTLTGTVTQINNLLAGAGSGTLSYIINSDTPLASATLTMTADDQGNSGSGGVLTGSDTATINITAVNDAPVATITPTTYAATEQTSLTLHGTGLSISDVDAGSSVVKATFTVTAGTLSAAAGTTGVTVGGSGTAALTLTGTVTQINNLLAGAGSGTLTYIFSGDAPPASATLTMTADDQGNTGTGGAKTGTDTATINIAAVNDAPTATITPVTYGAIEQANLNLHGTGLSISDADAASGSMQVTFTVVSGTLSAAAGTTGVTLSGSGTNTLTLTGTVTQINNLLAGAGSGNLTYFINSNTPPASDTLTMTVNDGGNTGSGGAKAGSDTATINITAVNDAPTGSVTITGTASQGQTLAVGNTLADADGMGTVSYQWRRNGVALVGQTNTTYVLSQVDVGTSITVSASYTDGQGTAESVLSNTAGPISDVNDSPTGTVTVTGTPKERATLTATNDLADADGMGTVSYQWLRDGTIINGATNSTYVIVTADQTHQLSVQASYTDGQGHLETVTSASTTTVAGFNALPTGSVTITGTTAQGADLTASNDLADPDTMVTGVSYQWMRNGIAINGATSSTLRLTQADVGTVITVVGSYTDGNGTFESVSSAATPPITNVEDAPTGKPVITGTLNQGQTLTSDDSHIADPDGLGAFSHVWKREGVAIVGATGNTYVLTQADVGHTLSVTTSYVDGGNTTESIDSDASAAIGNTNDVATGSVTITGTPTQNQVLTADTSGIVDPDGIGTISYQWQRDGTPIGGAINPSYTPSQADVGHVLTVVTSYTDLYGSPESLTSAGTPAIANANDAPTGSVSISGTPTQGLGLTATNTLADVDGMGTVSYQWLSDGGIITGATGDTYVLSQGDVGHFISVTANYVDGFNQSESMTSIAAGPVGNVNDAPVGSVGLSGTTAQHQTLTAVPAFTDADGVGTLAYQWLRDSAPVTGATSASYVLTQSDVSHRMSVVVSYVDALGSPESLTSGDSAIIDDVNDAPTGQALISGNLIQGQLLTASNTLSDLDGMGPVSYQWLSDNTLITGATGSTYRLTQGEVGHAISVTASYTDGLNAAESVTSQATAAIGNINDAATGSVVISGNLSQRQTLTATASATDPDGVGTFNYQWFSNAQPINGATGNALVLTQAEVGHTISVVASFVDGYGSPEQFVSGATLPIGNVNDAPVGTVNISGALIQGQVLTATPSITDLDGLGTISYQWVRDGTLINGATSSTLTLTQADVGHTIAVTASYTDGDNTAESVDSVDTQPIANINDVATGVVNITGSPTQGQTLTATPAIIDPDGVGTISYQWHRDGVLINGATGSTLVLTQSDVNHHLTVTASYTDALGSAESLSSAQTPLIANVNDTPTGFVNILGTAAQNQTLTALPAMADPDGLGAMSYQWLRDGAAIDGATSSTLVLTQSDVGHHVSVVASYTDGLGTPESITSQETALVANVNDAPTIQHAPGTKTAVVEFQFDYVIPRTTFDDVDAGDTLTISTGSLPSWLHFDSSTNTLTGTPQNADIGPLSIVITATDAQGASTSTTLDLYIEAIAINAAPGSGGINVGGLTGRVGADPSIIDFTRPTGSTDSSIDSNTPSSKGQQNDQASGSATIVIGATDQPDQPEQADSAHGSGAQSSSTAAGTRGKSPYGYQAAANNQTDSRVDKASWNFSDWASLLPATVLATQTNLIIEHSSLTLVPGLTTSSVSTQPLDAAPSAHSSVFERLVKATPVAVETSGVVLSLGSVWWAARGAGLITGLLATTPVWRQIDPLPVMLTPHDDGEEATTSPDLDDPVDRAEAMFSERKDHVEMIG